MSGKKLYEVKSVLRNAGDIQNDLFKNYIVRCRDLIEEIQKLRTDLDSSEFQDFPDTQKLRKRLEKSDDNIRKFVEQLHDLERQVERKARESSSDWYFDYEFYRAIEIKNKLDREMSGSVRPLQQDLERGLQNAKGFLEEKEERKKAQAQTALQQFSSKVRGARYKNPLDKDETMPMDKFCQTILGDTEMSNWAATALQELESLQQDQQWDRLLDRFDSLNGELDDKITALERRCEDEQNKMATVLAIEKFLYDEGCEFESTIIGEGVLADGVHIRTIKTGQPVEFTIGDKEADADDEGSGGTRVSFNIDNLQGEGNCAASVERLRRGLQKMGIDPGEAIRVGGSHKEGISNASGWKKENNSSVTGGNS